MHLPSILWLVVLGSLIRGTPKARAKRQVLEALLQCLLDTTGVDLEGAGVELNVLETQILLPCFCVMTLSLGQRSTGLFLCQVMPLPNSPPTPRSVRKRRYSTLHL